jgi:GTPase SAR1 family protein
VELDSPSSLVNDISESCSAGWGAMDGLVLVYDVGDRASFTALAKHFQKILELSGKAVGEFPVAVVANKDDMFQHSREVSFDQGADFAGAVGGTFGTVSARENYGVREAIQQIMKEVVKNRVAVLEEKKEKEERERDVKKIEQDDIKEKSMSRRQKLKRSMSSKISVMSRLSVGSTG